MLPRHEYVHMKTYPNSSEGAGFWHWTEMQDLPPIDSKEICLLCAKKFFP